MGLLRTLRPSWWFSAHLHVRFEATVPHTQGPPAGPPPKIENPDEIVIDDEDEEFSSEQPESGQELAPKEQETTAEDAPAPLPGASETRFLALDKCLPRRKFVEVRASHALWGSLLTPSIRSLKFLARSTLSLEQPRFPTMPNGLLSQRLSILSFPPAGYKHSFLLKLLLVPWSRKSWFG